MNNKDTRYGAKRLRSLSASAARMHKDTRYGDLKSPALVISRRQALRNRTWQASRFLHANPVCTSKLVHPGFTYKKQPRLRETVTKGLARGHEKLLGRIELLTSSLPMTRSTD